ncbi:MAG TPA: hypothetical protein VL098_04885 [Flavipsychrobacter sp.]|nr:hypothetical protein [Flavipsychrobacter sp.]
MKELLAKNKTTVAAILLAIVAFLKAKNIIDNDLTVLLMAILGATGLAAAKDSNVHSTSKQVRQADKEDALNAKKVRFK